jgi:hypothetical protein
LRTVRFLASMTDWLRAARSAGLGPDDIEAIWRVNRSLTRSRS